MTRTLAAHAAAVDVTLAGSVIALPPDQRMDLAGSLTARGHWVHADRIEGSYRGQAGVSLEEIHELAHVPDIRLDVHLMVDDLPAELAALPTQGITRITLQADGRDDLAGLVRLTRTYADNVWLAAHRDTMDATHIRQGAPDGVLVMLTPPGQPGHQADLDRLALVQATCEHGLPAGVDGGVTEANLGPISQSGARYAVVGRALIHASATR
jgi:pentose-5-phosphate-3-epimerase